MLSLGVLSGMSNVQGGLDGVYSVGVRGVGNVQWGVQCGSVQSG